MLITADRTLVDGYARWKLAQLKGRPTLLCMEYELNKTEALQMLLRTHGRLNGFSPFSRILLALDLEPFFRQKAQSNQRTGGQNKGSSKLPEAERVDVRSKIAAAAGVSEGNVTKVRQLMETADPELLQALRTGEIRIHPAWKWSTEPPEQQLASLRRYRNKKDIKRFARTLVRRHQPKSSPDVHADVGDLVRGLSVLESGKLGPIPVIVIKAPGRSIFLTEELFRALGSQQELKLRCVTNSR